ncbi:WhiB family transcriptional regulator [Streptomyces venezuelae]|uniref:Sporulation regulatory protein WhiB n=1 Tax=Streptomyces venezuelae (strain ATCC 10712 / CBS 650.69 / DSM 40230 / JCM 4526 / NBRC 13096 / PD 04745) TaxID=953739 RepID=F2RKY4_STRVP|nr:hypothetical protein vnz_10205 [Streptomyces venezuelae]CCA55373.1 Sporulation regulatory protein WhiB [Streptomyces venezuelae ATCC 10712]
MTRNFDWMEQASCAQTDPELFFPDSGNVAEARKVCHACPVKLDCEAHTQLLEEGFSRDQRVGTWAGQTGRDRYRAADPTAPQQTTHGQIVHLVKRGLPADTVADIVGCSTRTVWRVASQRRSDLGEAA